MALINVHANQAITPEGTVSYYTTDQSSYTQSITPSEDRIGCLINVRGGANTTVSLVGTGVNITAVNESSHTALKVGDYHMVAGQTYTLSIACGNPSVQPMAILVDY